MLKQLKEMLDQFLDAFKFVVPGSLYVTVNERRKKYFVKQRVVFLIELKQTWLKIFNVNVNKKIIFRSQ